MAGLLTLPARAQEAQRTPGETERAKLSPIVIQNYRPHDARGINMFEPPKLEGVPYNGFALSWGGGFTQQFQALHHSNTAAPVIVGGVNTKVNYGDAHFRSSDNGNTMFEDFRTYVGSWTLRADSGATVIAYVLDSEPRSGPPGWIARGGMRHTVSEMLAEVRDEIDRRAAKR